jgi:replication-associated recombination protein RarA
MLHSIIITGADEKGREEVISKILGQKGRNLKDFQSPDILIVKQEKIIGIETVRQIKIWLSKKAYQEKERFIIIYQAQNLTIEAQNAFLKTLEEPPENAFIILIVGNSHQLLPTIISRCQIFHLPKNTTIKYSLPDKQLAKIINKDLGRKILFAQSQGREKQKFLIWLREQKQYFRQNLNAETTKILLILEQAEAMARTNVSPRLALIYSLIKNQ